MADTHHKVLAEFMVRDRGFRRGVNRMKRGVDGLSTSVGRVTGGITRMGTMALGVGAGLGLYLGVDKARNMLLGYNSDLELLQIGIAGATAAQVSWTSAQSQAENYMMAKTWGKSVFRGLQEDAAALVGTTQDFVRTFQMFAGPTAATGLAHTDRELGEMTQEMTRLGVATSAVLMGGDITTGIQQLQRMLLGQAGAEMIMAQQLGIVGKEAEKFNKMRPADRYRRLRRELIAFKPAIKDFGESWEGVTSTLLDTTKRMGGIVGKPLFDYLKTSIMGLNTFLGENEVAVSTLATTIGETLKSKVEGFLGVTDLTKTKWEDVEKATERVGQHLDTAVGYAKVFGLVIGGSIVISGAASLLGTVTSLGSVLAGAVVSAKGLAGALATLPAGPLAAVTAIVAAGAGGFYSIYSAVQHQASRYNRLMGPGTEKASEAYREMRNLANRDATATSRLERQQNYERWVDKYERRLMSNPYDPLASGNQSVPLNLSQRFIGDTKLLKKQSMEDTRLRDIERDLLQTKAVHGSEMARDMLKRFKYNLRKEGYGRSIGKKQWDEWGELLKDVGIKSTKTGGGKIVKPKKIEVKQDFRHSVFHIHQDIETNEPDRIAIDFSKRIAALGARPAINGLEALLRFG